MEQLKSAWNNLFRQGFRSLLTIVGIAVGVFSVVLIGAIGDMGKSAVNQELLRMGVDGLLVSSSDGNLSEAELTAIRSSDLVAEATPLLFGYAGTRSRGQEEKAVVVGVDSNAGSIVSLTVVHGRMMNRQDMRGRMDICLVDEAFAQSRFGRSNIVGKAIEVELAGKQIPLQVVGVVQTGGNFLQGVIGNYLPGFLYLPYSTHEKYTGAGNFDQIAIKLKQGANADAAEDSLRRIVGGSTGNMEAVQVNNLSGYKDQLNHLLDRVSVVLGLIAGISLLVAGLSIMTVMLSSVGERTREIGIKKSIGASAGRIVQEFMLETFFLTLLGSLAGIFAGILLSSGIGLLLNMGFFFSASRILGELVFSLLIGMGFGIYPALKAAGLHPAEALRRDS